MASNPTLDSASAALLKVSCFLVRRPDLTHAQFFRYWTETHVPLLSKPMPGAPDIARSIHLHVAAAAVPGLPLAPYDGVAEIWFDSLDDAKALFANEHYRTVAGKDEENFLDRAKTIFLFSYENKII